jgi:CSLREA domain-containing protein
MEIRSFPFLAQFLKRLLKQNSKRNGRGCITRGRRLRFEQCEDRSMLAIFTVNSMLDNGDGANTTLREAIQFAFQSQDPVDTIKFDETVFASGGKILLTQGRLDINELNQLLIDGRTTSGTPLGITIDGREKGTFYFS